MASMRRDHSGSLTLLFSWTPIVVHTPQAGRKTASFASRSQQEDHGAYAGATLFHKVLRVKVIRRLMIMFEETIFQLQSCMQI